MAPSFDDAAAFGEHLIVRVSVKHTFLEVIPRGGLRLEQLDSLRRARSDPQLYNSGLEAERQAADEEGGDAVRACDAAAAQQHQQHVVKQKQEFPGAFGAAPDIDEFEMSGLSDAETERAVLPQHPAASALPCLAHLKHLDMSCGDAVNSEPSVVATPRSEEDDVSSDCLRQLASENARLTLENKLLKESWRPLAAQREPQQLQPPPTANYPPTSVDCCGWDLPHMGCIAMPPVAMMWQPLPPQQPEEQQGDGSQLRSQKEKGGRKAGRAAAAGAAERQAARPRHHGGAEQAVGGAPGTRRSRRGRGDGHGVAEAGAGAEAGSTAAAAAGSFVPMAGNKRATTVMVRNVPNNYTRAMLLAMLDTEGFSGLFDFVYLPIDFKSRASLGYAFVNLVEPGVVPKFWNCFDGFSKWLLPSKKVCRVGWAGPHQGLEAHIDRYRSSPVMHDSVPDEFKPILLQDGLRVDFPASSKAPRAPRVRQREVHRHAGAWKQ